MSKTKAYREQHDDLLKVVGEISAQLNVDKLSKDATEVRSLLSKLFGKLSNHLAIEDKSLYPRLLEQSDEQIKTLAKRFKDEMGGIGEAVTNYKQDWPSAVKIQDDPSTFITQTKVIFDALGKRIEQENNVLYKAVDEL